MNLVGKIFVVLILVMSLVFMSFAVAVFSTHILWKQVIDNPRPGEANHNPAVPVGLKYQLQNEQASVRNLTEQRRRLETDRDNERAARERRVAQLTTEVDTLKGERDRLTLAEQTLTQQSNDAIAAMKATQASLASMRDEIGVLRTEISKAQKDRDEKLKKSVELEDQLAQAQGELDRIRPLMDVLAAQVRKLDLLRQVSGAQLDGPVPPKTKGRVLASNENGRVQISLGFDDGLQAGNTLSVFRFGSTADTSKYLGEIRILTTEADTAIGEVVPGTKRGTIQKDDRVDTRLN